MLQQTQVARVVSRYEAFLERFPDAATCHHAPLADVLREWHGLGYPRRARDLHRIAGIVVEQHGGRLPDRLDELLALPGVGPYTARAVLVFAHERDEAVVDTNVARLMARWAGRPLTLRSVQTCADAHLPSGEGWRWNQALIDLGATVCTKRAPACDRCPAAPWCGWRRAGLPEPDPAQASAGTSRRQSRFTGSDRQLRGRVLAALVARPVTDAELAVVVDDPQRADAVLSGLMADGLVVRRDDGFLSLPEEPPRFCVPERVP
jgi:A/G-specific adenine glycosylase